MYDGDQPKDVPAGPGYAAYMPPGSWHAMKDTGDEPLTLVFATIPNDKKGLLSFFRRIAAKPGELATPLSPEDFAGIAAEHDLILRLPGKEQRRLAGGGVIFRRRLTTGCSGPHAARPAAEPAR